MGVSGIRDYLTHLAVNQRVAASTQNVAFPCHPETPRRLMRNRGSISSKSFRLLHTFSKPRFDQDRLEARQTDEPRSRVLWLVDEFLQRVMDGRFRLGCGLGVKSRDPRGFQQGRLRHVLAAGVSDNDVRSGIIRGVEP